MSRHRSTALVGVGIVGYGYWGPNLVRNLAETEGAHVAAVSDLSSDRLRLAAKRHPGVMVTTDFQALLRAPAVDAVAIATPASTHYALALSALRAGKHVLVEKPLTETTTEARHLIDEAARRQLVLMVDHTFVYTGAVQKIKELVSAGELGDLYYYNSMRVNLGLFQRDMNVIWDLAVHDLSILDHVLDQRPVAVSANGVRHIQGSPENMAHITLYYAGSMVAHINVNWLAPVKVRRALIGGSKRMIVFDDLEPSEKVKVYDKGVTLSDAPELIRQLLVGYRAGDMWAPKLPIREALATEAEHFVECIRGQQAPITDGAAGLRVVELLDAATRSLRLRGHPVETRRAEAGVMISFLDLRSQYRGLKSEIDAAVLRVLESGEFVLGAEVEAFERDFAAYCNVRHAVALNSGTSALHLALLAAEVGPQRRGDHDAHDLRCDRRCDPLRRCQARARRYRPAHLDDRSGPPGRCDHAADEGGAACAPARPHGRHGSDHIGGRRARSRCDRGCGPSPWRRVPGPPSRKSRRHGLLQLLSGEEPGHLRRGRCGRHRR